MKFIIVSVKQIKSRGGVLEQIKIIRLKAFKSAIKWAISHAFMIWCNPPHGQIDLKLFVNKFRSKSFHWVYDSYNLFYRLFIRYGEGMTMLVVRKLWSENRIFWDIKRLIVDF